MKIVRTCEMDGGFFGHLIMNDEIIGQSMEREWKENIPFLSCIPAGTYECFKRDTWKNSAKHGYTYEVNGVPGRTAILFHPATWPSQLSGCIAMGQYIEDYQNKKAVMKSSTVFQEIIKRLNGVFKFNLTIIEVK